MYIYNETKRNLVFVFILLIISIFYVGYEEIDPITYSLHLTPVSLNLALMFHGKLPGMVTLLIFNFSSFVVLGNDLWPTLMGSIFMLVLGLMSKRKIEHSDYWTKVIFSTVTMSLYAAFYSLGSMINMGNLDKSQIYTIIGSYISTWFITYIYYHVKQQELNKEKLSMFDKYRMVGQLAASVSHEIRNPLTTTRGFLQMMEQRQFSEEDRKRYIGLALYGIDQANEIITDYLNAAKPVSEQHEKLDVKEELGATIRLLTPYAQSMHVEFQIQHIVEGPLHIAGESRKLRQCLMNLIKNSIESMPNGGTLTVRTCKYEETVNITIVDTGIGMTKHQMKSLGLPFYTTKEKGTGLGLVVVMDLIKAMNGKIFFDSKPNKGTSCMIQFRVS